MTDHKIGTMIEENKAFVEATAWYVVCVVNVGVTKDQDRHIISDGVGTGTACTFKGHTIILTAEHVVGDAQPEALRFLVRVGNSIDWESSGTTGLASTILLPIKQIVRSKEKDLAAIEIERGGLEGLNVHVRQLPAKLARSRVTKSDGGVILIGYPADQAFEVSELQTATVTAQLMACVPTPLMGEIVASPKQPLDSSYDPEDHILIHFDPSAPHLKPHGYSGAAVWCDPSEQSTIWSADPVLFGLVTRAFVKLHLLAAVDAPTIRSFLEDSF